MNENCGKITITNTIKALGDFFYRNCQCILFGIFMVCLCIIVQIKFKIVPFLAYSVYADAINEILVNLSFSYIAAYIFYQLTSKFLLTIRNREIRPVIQKGLRRLGEEVSIMFYWNSQGKVLIAQITNILITQLRYWSRSYGRMKCQLC